MNQQPHHFYEFGPFRLDAVERLLLLEAQPLPLTPKSFELLLALVERHGHIVEKQDLMQAVWPDTFVEETNLTKNIFILRQALGEPDNGAKYIETVPRRGYRFIAPVREVRGKSEELTATEPANSQTAVAAEPEINAQTMPPGGHRKPVAGGFIPIRPVLWRLLAVALGASLIAVAVISYTRRSEDRSVEIKSLAVLPFKPLAPNSRDEALELGMADTLITKLSGLRQIIVRPTSAVRKYTALDQDPLAAGREQRVDAVLESSMSLSGEKIRVTVRLLDVRDGGSLWAYQCTEYCADIFAAQDVISQKVAEALALELTGEERKRLAKRYTNSAEAWKLYVRGRHLVYQLRIPDNQKAITYFQQAIALDQGFALAHVMLGFAYTLQAYRGESPAKELMPKAKAAFEQALKLDNQLAEAHSLLAQYKHYYEWDRFSAKQLHERALALDPNSADVHHHYALHLMHLVRFEQAIAEIRKAEGLDPADGFILRNVAQVLFFARRYDEAIEQSRRAIDLNPNSGSMYHWMIRAYEMKGDEQAAFAARLKQAEGRGADADEIAGMKAAYAAGGLKGYERIELDRQLEREKNRHVGQVNIAMLYARLGDKDQALTWLQRAIEVRDLTITALHFDPIWDSYRADPRFVTLVGRIGLEP